MRVVLMSMPVNYDDNVECVCTPLDLLLVETMPEDYQYRMQIILVC